MPDSTFIETYPLYRKFDLEIPKQLNQLPKPAAHMHCKICESDQTFTLWHGYSVWDHAQNPKYDMGARGSVVEVIYVCSACTKSRRHFLLKFDLEGQYVMKVGQEPSWDISIDRALAKALGDDGVGYYKKGLINESQGYGIGAFAYYRRVVEEIIDELLSEIGGLLVGEDHDLYLAALEKVKQTRVTQEKIALVKDLLPRILRPKNQNPLSILHGVLSEGLHGLDDEECIRRAATVREVLEFLVKGVSARKAEAGKFTEGMQKLLDEKSGSSTT